MTFATLTLTPVTHHVLTCPSLLLNLRRCWKRFLRAWCRRITSFSITSFVTCSAEFSSFETFWLQWAVLPLTGAHSCSLLLRKTTIWKQRSLR